MRVLEKHKRRRIGENGILGCEWIRVEQMHLFEDALQFTLCSSQDTLYLYAFVGDTLQVNTLLYKSLQNATQKSLLEEKKTFVPQAIFEMDASTLPK